MRPSSPAGLTPVHATADRSAERLMARLAARGGAVLPEPSPTETGVGSVELLADEQVRS